MTVRMPQILGALALLALSTLPTFAFDPLAGDTPVRTDTATIIVGSADFPESQLLATIYASALAAKGVSARTRLNIGSREVYMPALLDGSIDLLPEYAGAALRYLDRNSNANTPSEVIAALKAALPEGVSMLAPSQAQNATTVAVTRQTAETYGLTTIADLQPHAGELVIGGPPEWRVRPDGVPGLKRVYGLEFKSYRTLDVCGPLTVAALVNGQVDVACMNSSDPAIERNDLRTLEDIEGLTPSQNIVPLVATAIADDVAATLDAVSMALTTEDLVSLNGRVADHESFDAVAQDWLKAKGLE